ncbi:hypothetical protein D3C87_2064060 [compost metagenome]
MIEQDGAEGRGADAAELIAEDRQLEVAGAENQHDRHRDEVLRLGEIDLVLHPDPARCRSDQAEDHDGEPAQHRDGDRADDRAEFRRET